MATPPPKLPAHPLVSRSRHAERRPVPNGSCRGTCPQTAYSYCVIELEWRGWFCALRYSTDIAPGWLRGRRSGVGASSRSSWQHVVRGERAAPRDGGFWEISGVANWSAASPAAEGGILARSAIRKA